MYVPTSILIAFFSTAMVAAWSTPVVATTPLQPVVEGFLGVPIEPGADLWDPHAPTTLLQRYKFTVTMAGQAANMLDREVRGDGGGIGYSLGINGGAVVRWSRGVTGVWVMGSGQRRTWSDPDGIYRVASSPKIGVMTVSHAFATESGWNFGATLVRNSFSLNDTFNFLSYPTSSDPELSRYLYDLIPKAIGPVIDYEGLGSRIGLGLEVARNSSIGQFSIAGDYWSADSDWLTRHFNTLEDAQLDRAFLSGPKLGGGYGSWSGGGIEARWRGDIGDDVSLGIRVGRNRMDGDFRLRLRNPSSLPDENGRLRRIVESATWLADTLDVTSQLLGLSGEWQYSDDTQFFGEVGVTQYRFDTRAYGRTPVLNLDRGVGTTQIVDHAAHLVLDGDTDALNIEVGMNHRRIGSPWHWLVSTGLVQINGGSDTFYSPRTAGFGTSPSDHRWSWDALRLGYVEVVTVRRVTSQIVVSYLLRQYVPLGGEINRSGEPTEVPGDIKGVRLGSLHQIRISLSL